jgi:hypothetical protein
MAYAGSLEGIKREVQLVTPTADAQDVPVFPGLAAPKKTADAYGGPSHPPIVEQVPLVRELGLKGYVVFCYGWIKESEIPFQDIGKSVLKGIEKK